MWTSQSIILSPSVIVRRKMPGSISTGVTDECSISGIVR
jgi:hypothetical protein